MSFPYVKKGLMTMYKASLIMILSYVLDGVSLLVFVVGTFFSSGSIENNAAVYSLLMILITYGATLIFLTLQIKAFLIARKEVRTFNYPMIIAIISVIFTLLSFVASIISSRSIIADGLNTTVRLLNDMVAILVCFGVINVYELEEDIKMVHAGYIVILLFMFNMCVSRGLESMATMNIAGDSIEGIIYVFLRGVSYVLIFARLILYSLFLRRARRTVQ